MFRFLKKIFSCFRSSATVEHECSCDYVVEESNLICSTTSSALRGLATGIDPRVDSSSLNEVSSLAPTNGTVLSQTCVSHVDRGLVGSDDMIFLITGPTGSGITQFCDQFCNHPKDKSPSEDIMEPTEDLAINVTALRLRKGEDNSSNVILIDTSGYNEDPITMEIVLKNVRIWLEKYCTSQRRLDGVLFLNKITPDYANVRYSLETCLQDLKCVVGNYPMGLMFATSQWDRLMDAKGRGEAEQREAKLTRDWERILERRIKVGRFEGTQNSALGILSVMMNVARGASR